MKFENITLVRCVKYGSERSKSEHRKAILGDFTMLQVRGNNSWDQNGSSGKDITDM